MFITIHRRKEQFLFTLCNFLVPNRMLYWILVKQEWKKQCLSWVRGTLVSVLSIYSIALFRWLYCSCKALNILEKLHHLPLILVASFQYLSMPILFRSLRQLSTSFCQDLPGGCFPICWTLKMLEIFPWLPVRTVLSS